MSFESFFFNNIISVSDVSPCNVACYQRVFPVMLSAIACKSTEQKKNMVEKGFCSVEMDTAKKCWGSLPGFSISFFLTNFKLDQG